MIFTWIRILIILILIVGFVRNSGVRFSVEALNDFLGAFNCDHAEFLAMVERTPYRDIWHTFSAVTSVARWDRVRDTGRHLTLHYGHFNLEAQVWLKIVCSTLLPGKHMTDVTREGVVFIYRLMKGLSVNVGAILRQNMPKFWTNKRWCFCYGSIITRNIRALMIEKEVHDVCPPGAPHLVCHLVNVTRTKAHDPSHWLFLLLLIGKLVMIVG